MKKKFMGTERAKRVHLQALRAEFEALRMKTGESVSEYISRTMTITNKRQINGEKLEDVTIVKKILRFLTAKFNYVDRDEQGLQAAIHPKGSSPSRGKWKDKNDHATDSKGKWKSHDNNYSNGYKSNSVNKSKVECFRCHRYDHYKFECRTNLNKQCGERSNFAEKEEVVSLLMACHANQGTHQNLWYIDIGYSNHMCGDKSALSDLDETFCNAVTFGDNSKVSIIGKGSVRIHSKEKYDQIISNVFFVPNLKTNLLSAGQLQEKRYEIFI
ncbi:uncharacterized protein LOC116139403 [Pistacia vera]|uniref:uncharacterized protein LOC116139403 n=1 Tax=Pistacia vera TaxID=55513 RepID=UPI001263AC45|nr:uncharacterized protein LOC116139403 [Pistacia vera]